MLIVQLYKNTIFKAIQIDKRKKKQNAKIKLFKFFFCE